METVDKPASTDNVLPLHEAPLLKLVPELSQAAVNLEAAAQARWQSQKPAVQKRWLMLHASELDQMNGSVEPLAELVSARYALSPDESEKQVRQFFDTYVPISIPDAFNGRWEHHVAAARSRWTKLNIAELQQSKGNKQMLVNLVRRRYGLTPDEARKQVTQFISRCSFDTNRTV